MTAKILKTELEITFPFALLIAILLCCDKTGMMSVSLIAVILHETGHLIALYALKLPPRKINLRLCGIQMVQTRLFESTAAQITVAAAGPAANLITSLALLPLSAYRFCASLCACGFVIGLFNLLPLYELDGGDILRCLLSIRLDPKTVRIVSGTVNAVILILLAIAGVLIFISPSHNPTMLIATVYLLLYIIIKCRCVPKFNVKAT